MRYKISDSISFLPVTKQLTCDAQSVYAKMVLIKDAFDERQFLVNETTQFFIKKFCAPKSFDEINNEVALEINADVDKVRKITQPFLKYIKYRRFIVPENYVLKNTTNRALFEANTILNEYKVESIIDINGDTDIYKAIDLSNENNVVIKLIKQLKESKVVELKREFYFLKTLEETSAAPKAYQFITNENYAYFTQEFVDGLSLPQFINRKKKSTLNLILKIVGNILKAFKKIHAKNIVHGDIHPSNIIITHLNEIKVIDFGLSINSESDKDEIVNFGGAYFFMPPERIKKTTYQKYTRKPDFYSDVFQLGVVLYTLLYNEYPFNGITWEELATEIKEKEIKFPDKSQYNFLVPDWLKNLISKCVAKKPENRFNNAQELYNAYLKNITENARKIRSAVKI